MYQLVLLKTLDEAVVESNRMQSAVQYFFPILEKAGVAIYSLREGETSLLTLSAHPDGYTDHIVGYQNAPATPAQLDILNPLLKAAGIENRCPV